jgi:hypothetical protein
MALFDRRALLKLRTELIRILLRRLISGRRWLVVIYLIDIVMLVSVNVIVIPNDLYRLINLYLLLLLLLVLA